MATNFNKEGYSTGEVGQILGCCQNTVWNMVNQGKIEALIERKDKRKVIRITRAALIEYLKKHRERYSKELLSAFGIGESLESGEENKTPDDRAVFIKDLGGTNKPTGAWADLLKEPEKKAEDTVKEQMRSPGYLASGCSDSVSRYMASNRAAASNGATMPPRGSSVINYSQREQQKSYSNVKKTNYATRNYNRYSCQILVNGRISVCGISKTTAKNIVDCLMEDPYMRPDSIEIKFVEEQ